MWVCCSFICYNYSFFYFVPLERSKPTPTFRFADWAPHLAVSGEPPLAFSGARQPRGVCLAICVGKEGIQVYSNIINKIMLLCTRMNIVIIIIVAGLSVQTIRLVEYFNLVFDHHSCNHGV